jgi:hypothetical protein
MVHIISRNELESLSALKMSLGGLCMERERREEDTGCV